MLEILIFGNIILTIVNIILLCIVTCVGLYYYNSLKYKVDVDREHILIEMRLFNNRVSQLESKGVEQ